jgi:phenylalanyl-tRNA synthetase beta chain
LKQKLAESVKARLVASGVNEIITYSFIDPEDVLKLGAIEGDPMRWFVKLLNPLSEDLSVMRTTLLASLLKVVKYNVNREQYDVQVFEVGNVFWQEAGKDVPDEETMLGIALTGAWQGDEWYEKARSVDFFDIKGAIEAVLHEIGLSEVAAGGNGLPLWSVRLFTHPALHPGRSAELLIGEESIGFFGELHPDAQTALDVPRTYVAELNFNKLLKNAQVTREFKEIPKYPAISLDIAVLVDDTVENEQLIEAIRKTGGAILEQVSLFDLYTGKGVPEGKKSMAYSMTFRVPDRTLTDEEALEVREKVLEKLSKDFGAEIRS